MLIYSGTGVLKTPELIVTKGIGSLLISSSKKFSELTNETINVFVEKQGKNLDICRDVLLSDFIALMTYGQDAIQGGVIQGSTFGLMAMCELTEPNEDGLTGFIGLLENETIKIELKNLISTSSYQINGIEEPFEALEIIMVQRKTIASETINHDLDVRGFDILSFTNSTSITEVALTYESGAVVKMDMFELENITRTIDALSSVNGDGTVTSGYSTRLVIPLKKITNVNFRKNTGTLINCTMRIDESDFNQFQNN